MVTFPLKKKKKTKCFEHQVCCEMMSENDQLNRDRLYVCILFLNS